MHRELPQALKRISGYILKTAVRALLCGAVFSVGGCMKYGPVPEERFSYPMPPGEEPEGVFIVCEGNFMYGNASLSFYLPSSGELQNRDMEGKPLYARMAEMVAKWGEGLDTPCGYNQIGAVVGATYPEEQKIIRELLPKSYFLVPGYGAQGATAKDIANAFNDDGLGAIVNSSRGIMCAWKKTGNNGEDYKEAARAEAIRMRDDIVAAIK